MYDVNSSNLLWIHFDRPGYKTVKHITKNCNKESKQFKESNKIFYFYESLKKKDDIKDIIPV